MNKKTYYLLEGFLFTSFEPMFRKGILLKYIPIIIKWARPSIIFFIFIIYRLSFLSWDILITQNHCIIWKKVSNKKQNYAIICRPRISFSVVFQGQVLFFKWKPIFFTIYKKKKKNWTTFNRIIFLYDIK